MRQWIKLFESALPEDVVKAFEHLGDSQRGEPEHAMLQVQMIMGGGVLSDVVEHVGDITFRMSHVVRHNSVEGYEKVVKTYRWLNHKYGFEREYQENITSNARLRGIPRQELADQIRKALRHYAEEHARLPVYNKAQWLARQAAIFVGLENFKGARQALKMLLNMAPGEDAFQEQAMKFTRNPDGSLRQYKLGSET